MTPCGCHNDVTSTVQRRTLWALLSINAAMFLLEAIASWIGDSSGLLADSLDMAADALVYGIALSAVGGSTRSKAYSAIASGLLQIGLGLGVLLDVLRRGVMGSDPVSTLMVAVGALALTANVTCLMLVSKHRHGEVHMRASWIFSRNDVIANLGVMLSGGLVALLGSHLPDLGIGSLISLLVVKGGIEILRDARRTIRAATAHPDTPGRV